MTRDMLKTAQQTTFNYLFFTNKSCTDITHHRNTWNTRYSTMCSLLQKELFKILPCRYYATCISSFTISVPQILNDVFAYVCHSCLHSRRACCYIQLIFSVVSHELIVAFTLNLVRQGIMDYAHSQKEKHLNSIIFTNKSLQRYLCNRIYFF